MRDYFLHPAIVRTKYFSLFSLFLQASLSFLMNAALGRSFLKISENPPLIRMTVEHKKNVIQKKKNLRHSKEIIISLRDSC